MTQLYAQSPDIEAAISEFVRAAFSPEERKIQRLKARLEILPPRSHARIIVQQEILEARTRQLVKELAR